MAWWCVVRGVAFLTAVAVMAAGAPGARAITINDPAAAAGTAATLGAPFEAVARLIFDNGDGTAGLCTGTLISATTILTADHCTAGRSAAATQVQFRQPGGALRFTRGVSSIATYGPEFDGTNLLDGTDISVLTLSQAVTLVEPMMLYEGVPLGEVVRFVGYGQNGTGSAGTTGLDLVRRGAENVIDFYGAAPRPYVPGTGGIGSPTRPQFFVDTAEILSADFDDFLDDGGTEASNTLFHVGSDGPMLPAEGSGAPGDSGGPLLLQFGMSWLIAGVLSGGADLSQTLTAPYGGAIYWTAVTAPETRAFVESFGGVYFAEVPAPAAGGLMLAAALALGAAGGLGRRLGVAGA